MVKFMKAFFIVSAVIVTLFIILFAVTLISGGGRLVNRETNTHDISDPFSSVSLETKTADVLILPSEDGKAKVVCYENPKIKSVVSVEDGRLNIKRVDTRKWYEYIGFDFGRTKITVYLPSAEYEALSIRASTGDLTVKDTSAAEVKVSLSTGDTSLSGIKAKSVTVTASTGNITLKSVNASADVILTASTGDISLSDVACTGEVSLRTSTGSTSLERVSAAEITARASTGNAKLNGVNVSGELSVKCSTGNVSLTNTITDKLTVETDTGNVRFSASDANEIYVNTDTGSVKGNLLTDKIFLVRTDTGEINVPKTTVGGRCEITTDTGDVIITVGKGD